MNTTLSSVTLVSLLLAALTASLLAPHPGPERELRQEEIFFAVLEGAFDDGVKLDVVESILEADPITSWPRYFIQACPICTPAYDALRTFRASPDFYARKMKSRAFGHGLRTEQRLGLMHPDPQTRYRAITELIRTWVERRMDALRLTDAERGRWKITMRDWRKKGLGYLQGYHADPQNHVYDAIDSCAFCDGAASAFGPLR